jgi:hypothetical protein
MATYPNERWAADGVIQALDGTTDPATGLPFIPKGTGPTSSPSLEIQYNRRLARQNGILAGWRQGMVVDEGDLKIGAYPIAFTLRGIRRSFDGASGIAVSDDATTRVYLDTNGLLQTQADFPSDVTSYLPLAEVVTTGGVMTIADKRVLTTFTVPSLDVTATQTRMIVSAHADQVGSSENALEIFKVWAPAALTIEQVQMYCMTVSATATVDIRKNSTTILSAPGNLQAGSVITPVVVNADIAHSDYLSVHVTTDASGSIGGLSVSMWIQSGISV